MARTSAPSTTGTLTLTIEELSPSSSAPTSSQRSQPPETLVLRLKRPKKKVSWKEGTVDNEFLNRKSSKKCCIFHKQKPFDEDDSDEEDRADKPAGDSAGPSRCCSHVHDH
ncbi:hypothetical protein B296_00018847 [Ensete ventricosum]|uniref:Protein phosphatase 1 regulatory subunit 11 n=1 Tax=Ensete ventricosum TaxID=4639 RepID=A0A426XRL2_ENSVE|nr:hypothetical protein B296_00018847 [Ensete ventricosum]